MKNNRKLALFGIIGGILMMLANILVHTGTGMTGENPDPGWLSIPAILCGISEILAVLGTLGLLAGWVSLYRMTAETCGTRMQKFALIPAFGAVGMALFHGNISCIEPLIYQVLAQSGGEGMYSAMDAMISSSFAPVDLLILVTCYLQLILLLYGIFSGRFGVKKWMIVFNPVVGLVLGVVLGAILPPSLNGFSLGMRNLGEGLMYVTPFVYWKAKA